MPPLQICTNRQFASPSAANGALCTTTGVLWTSSPWVQIAPSTDTVWVLTGIALFTTDPTNAHRDYEIDIGIGGAGSEVVIATFRYAGLFPNSIASEQIRCMIPIDGLNGRHAARVRVNTTSVFNISVSLSYLKNPISGTLLLTSKPLKVYPPAANSASVVTSGAAWNNSAWVQLVAATAADIVITHVVGEVASAGSLGEIDLGVGPPGSEVVIATHRYDEDNSASKSGGFHEFPNPLDNVPAGSRLSFRGRSHTTGRTMHCAVMYHEKPL